MRQLLLGVDRTVNFLTQAFIAVAVFLLAVMALLGSVDVISLNLLGRPVTAATEIASALLPIAVMLAMSYAQQQRANITVDLFSHRFNDRVRRACLFVALVIGAFVFLMLSWGAWSLALSSIAVSETAVAAIRFPVWPTKVIFAFGASVCTLQLVKEIVRLAILGEESPIEAKAS